MGTPLLDAFLPADLRVIICEDEILLATDVAQQLQALHVQVVAILASLAELNDFLAGGVDANAALLDVQLRDGPVYPLVPRLEEQGLALAFHTAYLASECPSHCAHIPWFGKFTPVKDIVEALCAARDARRHDHHH